MQKLQNFWFLLSATLNRMRKCETRKLIQTAKFSRLFLMGLFPILTVAYWICDDGTLDETYWIFPSALLKAVTPMKQFYAHTESFTLWWSRPWKLLKVTITRTHNRKYDLPTRGGKIWSQGWTIDFKTLRPWEGQGKSGPSRSFSRIPYPKHNVTLM